ARNVNNKRKLGSDHGRNSGQQQSKRLGVVRTHASRPCNKKAYAGNLPYYNKLVINQLVKFNYKARILELKRRILKNTVLTTQYAVPNKEDTAYLCLHFTRKHEDLMTYTSYLEDPIRRIEDQECMTRSSTKELVIPYKEPERVFRSSRKLSRTHSLDYLSSPEFNLFSDLEDQFEEEETETIGEPTTEEVNFFKELCDNTFSGSDNEDANEHIEKVLEIVDLFHIPNITQDQEVISFYKGLDVPTRQILDSKGALPSMKAADAKKAIQDMADHSQKWHNRTSTRCRSTKTFDGLAEIQAQLNNLRREIKKVNEKIHEENSNLIKEIRASTDAAIRNQGASIKALEIQIGQMSKVLQERGFRNLPSSTETNPRDHFNSISTTVEADAIPIRRIGPSRCVVSGPQNSKLFFVPSQATIPFPSRLYDDCYDEEEGSCGLKNFDAYSIRTTLLDDALPPKEKDLGSFSLPCYINNLCFNKTLADLGASVSIMPFSTYTNLGLGELALTKLIVELANRTVKRPKGIAENVLVGIDKFLFPVDFIVLDIPEDIKTPLIIGRPFLSITFAKTDVFKRKITLKVRNNKVMFKSDKPTSNIIKRFYVLNLLYGDDIELNDLNEPLELRRNQVDDLGPTIEEGEIVDEPIRDVVNTRHDNKIIYGLDEYPSYYDFDRKIHISYAFNLQFSCMIDFAVMEYMDAYRDEGMGDIIAGRPFCREACVKERRYDGMITIYNENDSVTYQMARSHLRFKHLTNAQCNKMRPLLKVSAQDELKVISYPCQKLKGFNKGVLNLGLEHIKNEKVNEWLTRGDVSMHEMR
ncbi:retrovirus-related pol polyprotein from transposon TNT 1-94, partial [Tanacetum coccineum]